MRRAVPPDEAVDQVLEPVRRAAARKAAAEKALREAVRAAALHDPRPTNRQIGKAARLTEGPVRAILEGRRGSAAESSASAVEGAEEE